MKSPYRCADEKTNFEADHIEALEQRIKELNRELEIQKSATRDAILKIVKLEAENKVILEAMDKTIELLNAVGHIGIDFGHGEYQLSVEQIKQAQELYSELSTLKEKG